MGTVLRSVVVLSSMVGILVFMLLFWGASVAFHVGGHSVPWWFLITLVVGVVAIKITK